MVLNLNKSAEFSYLFMSYISVIHLNRKRLDRTIYCFHPAKTDAHGTVLCGTTFAPKLRIDSEVNDEGTSFDIIEKNLKSGFYNIWHSSFHQL